MQIHKIKIFPPTPIVLLTPCEVCPNWGISQRTNFYSTKMYINQGGYQDLTRHNLWGIFKKSCGKTPNCWLLAVHVCSSQTELARNACICVKKIALSHKQNPFYSFIAVTVIYYNILIYIKPNLNWKTLTELPLLPPLKLPCQTR